MKGKTCAIIDYIQFVCTQKCCHVKLLFPLVLHSVQLSERLEVYEKSDKKEKKENEKKNKMKKIHAYTT